MPHRHRVRPPRIALPGAVPRVLPAGGPRHPDAWLDCSTRALRRYASGAAYQNYTDPALTDWRSAYYGPAAARLAKVKHTYDPQRLFDFPQAL